MTHCTQCGEDIELGADGTWRHVIGGDPRCRLPAWTGNTVTYSEESAQPCTVDGCVSNAEAEGGA